MKCIDTPDEDVVTSDDALNIDLNKTDELSDNLHSEHYDPYHGANIADHAFLEDYHSVYWQPAMSLDIGRRLNFVHDTVGQKTVPVMVADHFYNILVQMNRVMK